MKARKVKGLDPDGTLADNAALIVETRLGELFSHVPAALNPADGEALHDLRIAAKRLRYVLELTGFCFGSEARTAAKRCRELQDVIGEIHDCDVMLPLLLDELERVHATDAADLELLAAHLRARRGAVFERFVKEWNSLTRRDFRPRLEAALRERPCS